MNNMKKVLLVTLLISVLIEYCNTVWLDVNYNNFTWDNEYIENKEESDNFSFDITKVENYEDWMVVEELLGNITNQYWVEPEEWVTEIKLRKLIKRKYPQFKIKWFSDIYGLLLESKGKYDNIQEIIYNLGSEEEIKNVEHRLYMWINYIRSGDTPSVTWIVLNDSDKILVKKNIILLWLLVIFVLIWLLYKKHRKS